MTKRSSERAWQNGTLGRAEQVEPDMQDRKSSNKNCIRRWSRATTTFGSVTDKISDVTLKEADAVPLVHRLWDRVS